jgi:hypothetical protein
MEKSPPYAGRNGLYHLVKGLEMMHVLREKRHQRVRNGLEQLRAASSPPPIGKVTAKFMTADIKFTVEALGTLFNQYDLRSVIEGKGKSKKKERKRGTESFVVFITHIQKTAKYFAGRWCDELRRCVQVDIKTDVQKAVDALLGPDVNGFSFLLDTTKMRKKLKSCQNNSIRSIGG